MGPDFCPDCGNALTDRRIEGRQRRFCPACEQPVYRNPKPAAGVLVVDGKSVLLVERTAPPGVGTWSLPAGYLEVDEPPEEAAVRELREETTLRVDVADLTLFETVFVDAEGLEPVLVVAYTAPAAATEGTPTAGSDAAGARFWERSALSEAPPEPGYLDVFRRAIDAVE